METRMETSGDVNARINPGEGPRRRGIGEVA
jgi:hypothetical protein